MSKKRLIFGIVFFVSIFIVGFSLYLGIILFGNYAIDNKELVMNAATSVEDPEGNLITKLYIENRELVSIEDVPEHVIHAFIAVEDHRFYNHRGFDLRAIGRALYRDIVSQSKAEGGSTITQQLAKNVFLTNDKTWLRKTKEVLIAVNLEYRYSKDEILEMYLNRIYFGHGAHGIETASQLYFDKSVKELTIDEGALLAALPKGPNNYSPIQNPERGMKRRNLVLSLMEQRGFLSAEEAVRLQGKTIPTQKNQLTDNPAYLAYVDLVLDEAEKTYRLTQDEILKGGYRIVVEMNPQLQEVSFQEFQDSANFPSTTGERQVEGSFVLIDNETGGVIAAQGGRDYVRRGFNRVTAQRQPGSVIKPMAVYAPAIETGHYEPYSLLKDELMDYEGYMPRNYNSKYSGEITMYDAMKDSVNAPAVWLLNEVGIDTAKDSLAKQDIHLEEDGLAIALGGLRHGMSPLQIAASYGAYANNGIYRKPYFIREIYDRNGELIASRTVEEREVLSPQTAWYMTRMLEAVVKEGTGTAGSYNGPLAGKTGTTSFGEVAGGARDIWFAGFTPEYSGVVWMGYDSTDKEHYLTSSSSVPTELFKNIIGNTSLDDRLMAFERPSFVVDLEDPIRIVAIEDLTANMSLSWRGTNVNLQWSGSEDDRLHYYIYEKKEDGKEKIGEVVGENKFTIQEGVNVFSSKSYVVVPFNPQTNKEGDPSNIVKAQFRLFSQEDNAS
ncbi:MULTISPECIES: transglycosylase domain-containing protein [Bacillaceae]|uniref:PBP1A family penicillin-binding protein n=1 Tax=Evansella alkalicola TaxID=745819 RepID=A0ABS6JQ80_9BACI|nr:MULTISPECIES: PBP1A family penicillin-binding protein [Bacillaceae]MBU9720713.1 PBP1A family penicillin-binding protein [Bacillus alkalicola]